jgi:hypothetical protein
VPYEAYFTPENPYHGGVNKEEKKTVLDINFEIF